MADTGRSQETGQPAVLQVVPPSGDTKVIEVLPENVKLEQYIQQKTESCDGRKDIQDAFCVVDLGRLIDVHALWESSLPNIKPFYAVKANSDIMVLKTLAAIGTGFDCSSMNEMKMVLDLSVSPDRIIYANTCKQTSHILWAKEKGVDLMTFDNESELLKIQKHYPLARLVIRIFADSPDAYSLGNKFGCELLESQDLLKLAKSLELNVVGVSFHVGSVCTNPKSYQDALESAHQVFQFAENVGYHMTLVDIGGGYHGWKDEFSSNLFQKTSRCVLKGLEKFSDQNDLTVIAEPGTFYPCSAYAIAVNIINRRLKEKPDPEKSLMMYYVNDGTYGSFDMATYPSYTHFLKPKPLKDTSEISHNFKSIVWGPTRDSKDKICEYVLPELQVGDWIYFDDMGAYSVCVATTFNGFEAPNSYYYIKESKRVIFSRMMQS